MTKSGLIPFAALALFLFQPAEARTSAGRDNGPPAGAERTAAWNAEKSDMAPDSSIIYGRLPNGLRYAIRPNDHPQNQTLMRMTVDFGSAAETEEEQGLAHFIEHMVFNGTTHVAEGEMVPMLERLGLAFGADTNASTGYTRTIYQLDLPKADPFLTERALFLFRETASEVLFDDGAVDRERGVVLAEMRQREDFYFQALRASNDFFYPGSYYSTRYPIGLKSILETAPAGRMRALYHKWYRPDRIRIVIVGPVNVRTIEQQIVERFSDWQRTDSSPPDFDNCRLDSRRPTEAALFTHDEILESITIRQILDDQKRPDNFDRALIELKMRIAGAILQDRIIRRTRKEDGPYLGSSLGFNLNICDQYAEIGMTISGKDGSWRQLMPMAEQLVRQAYVYGFSRAEVEEQLRRFDTSYENAARAEKTRASNIFAHELSVLHDDVITDATAKLLGWRQARPFLTAEAVSAEFGKWFSRLDRPLILLTSKDAMVADGDVILSAYEESRAAPVTPPPTRSEMAFTYNDFGPAGKIVTDTRIEDLGIRTIRFENGVMLNIKKTDFEDNRVRYSLRIDGGKLAFGKDDAALATFMGATYVTGGLGAHDYDDLRAILAGSTARPRMGAGDDFFGATGTVTPDDLDLQLKLMAAYLTDPAYNDEAVRQFRRPLPEYFARLDATPGSAASNGIARILTDNDPRFSVPDEKQLESYDFDDLKNALGNMLLSNRLEIALVGDLDEEAAIASVAHSLGALPARKDEKQSWDAALATSWSGKTGTHILRHRGEANQMGWARIWTSNDDNDQREEQSLALLARILTIRLTEELREKLGTSYGASANSSMSDIYPGRGTFAIGTNGDPKDLQKIEASVDAIMSELGAAPVDNDLLERARRPLLEGYDDWWRSNGTWLSITSQAQGAKERLDRYRNSAAILASISAEEIWQVARRYLVGRESYIFRTLPVGWQATGDGKISESQETGIGGDED